MPASTLPSDDLDRDRVEHADRPTVDYLRLLEIAKADLARPDTDPDRLRQNYQQLQKALEEALICPVTKVPVRAAWMAAAAGLIARTEAAILFIDLDGFKLVNDRYGHWGGDVVLSAYGARLREWCLHMGGIHGRVGGDEFAVAVPDRADLDQHVEALRAELAQPIRCDGLEEPLVVGASIGVARLADLPQPDPEVALKAADAAMYQSKFGGRGRWRRRSSRCGGGAR